MRVSALDLEEDVHGMGIRDDIFHIFLSLALAVHLHEARDNLEGLGGGRRCSGYTMVSKASGQLSRTSTTRVLGSMVQKG